jgi:EmrB/QacA subfamily drug resistance transporter
MPAVELSPRRRSFVLFSMCLALVLVVAGVTMLSNALPHIAEGLHLSQTSQTWVIDSYALTLAALLLVAGALGDRYGRRGALLAGTVVFGVGTLLSAFAGSGGSLITFRAITGVGAALIMPGTLSTITSVYPPERRAKAVAIWAGFAMTGGTLGLLGSGLLLESFWWGSVFLVSAVLAGVAFLLISLAVPSTRSDEHVPLDPMGTVLSALGVASIVFAIIEGPERGWTSVATMGGLFVGAVALVAFVAWELRTPEPLLDPRLFRLRGFATGSASMLVLFLSMFGFFLVAIQFLQLQLGYSPLKAAVALLPMSAVMMPLSTYAAQLSERYGQRRIASLGMFIGAAGLISFASLDTNSSYWQFLVGLIIVSVGIGLAMTPATTAIIASLPSSKQGVASAVNDTAREVGAALGVAILASAFNSSYRSSISPHLEGLPAETATQSKEAPALALQAARDLGDGGQALARAAQDAFVSGLRSAVLIGGALMVIGGLYTWLHGPRAETAIADELDGEVEVEVPVLAGAAD